MTTLRLISFSVLLFLASCTVYDKKAIHLIDPPELAFREHLNQQLEGLPTAQWWKAFGDPSLNQLMTQLQQENLDIQTLLLRKKTAELELQKIRTRYYPDIFLNPSLGTNYTEVTKFTHLIGFPLSVSYELDVWNRIRTSLKIQEMNIEAAAEDIRAARLSFGTELAKTYFDIKTALAQKEILKKRDKRQRQLLTLVKTQKNRGFANQAAVLSLERSVNDTKIQLIANDELVATLQNTLSNLLARPYQDFDITLSRDQFPWKMNPGLPTNFSSRLIYRRPDILKSVYRMVSSRNDLYLRQVELLPNFQLSSSLGFSANALNKVFRSNFFSANGSIGASYPLFDAGERQLSIEQAEQNFQIELIDYKLSLLNALREIEQILIENQSSLQQLEQSQSNLQNNLEQLNITKGERAYGFKTKIQVLQSEIALMADMANIINRHNALISLRLALIRALGGGISNEEVVSKLLPVVED